MNYNMILSDRGRYGKMDRFWNSKYNLITSKYIITTYFNTKLGMLDLLSLLWQRGLKAPKTAPQPSTEADGGAKGTLNF